MTVARPRLDERAPLDLAQVRTAAIAVVDREGLPALTMRRLAAAVGVEAPSLYRLVPGKAALLDAVYEGLVEEIAPVTTPDWRAHLHQLADAWRGLLARHPAFAPLFAARPPRSARWLQQADHTTAVLRAAGFDAATAIYAFKTLSVLVVGQAQNAHSAPPVSPLDQADWSAAHVAGLDPAALPALTAALAEDAGRDFDRWFTLSLGWFLDGLARSLR